MTDQQRQEPDNQEQVDREPLVQYEDLEQATGFTQVSNAVLRCYPELSDGEKMTYIVLKSFAYVTPETFVGQETLARARDITVSTVSRHLTRLIEVGLVRVRRRGQGKTNIWIISRIPRSKLDQYIGDWRPNLTISANAQTKTCDNAQVKDRQSAQSKTAQNPQAEEEQSEEDETEKRRRGTRQGASSSLFGTKATTASAKRDGSYTRESQIVENSGEGPGKLSTIGENVESLVGVIVERFDVKEQRGRILTYLKQFDVDVVARALDSVTATVDRGDAVKNPVAYLYSIVKIMQVERDAANAEHANHEAQRGTMARNWARNLLREWEAKQVRAILMDTYRSAEFVDGVMADLAAEADT